MKQSISFMLATVLSLSSFQNAFAKTNDVTGDGIHYVRVTRENDNVKFEECFKGSNPECIRTLGPKTWYSVSELKSQRTTETIQAYGSILADVGVLAVSVYLGGAGSSLLIHTSTGTMADGIASGIMGLIGGGAGAVAGTVVVTTVRALNPHEQFKQASVLSNNVINDKSVETANMNKFIERLTLVLEKL